MNIVTAPNEVITQNKIVFLAGTIEMGHAEEWQTQWAERHKDKNITFLNPRRKEWDASWKQSINEPKFKQQVDWELDGLEDAHEVWFYFKGGSMSPITLMELGYMAGFESINNFDNIFVVCDKNFWRRGNVEIICDRAGIPLYDNVEIFHHDMDKRHA